MWLTCEKIADLKKKILVDPDNTRTYEAQIWQHYATVTELNDSYYEDKKAASGEVVNAYVMFRSMEGKNRAIKAYDIHCCQRICVSFCCCLSQFFKKKQLIRKGFLTVESPVDPQIIVWENLGISCWSRCAHRMITSMLVLMVLLVGFGGQVYLSNLEKDYNDIVRSDCKSESFYNIDQAWLDYKAPQKQRMGIMNCYCKQMHDVYGTASLKMLFADGEQYCKQWYYTWVQASYTAPSLGIWIAIINVFCTLVCQFMGMFMRGIDSEARYINTTFNIFLSQYINTAIVVLLAQNSFLWSEEARASYDKKLFLVGVYDEFNEAWYLRVGTAIFISQAVMVILPHFFTIF
jgi:hypothetical protein